MGSSLGSVLYFPSIEFSDEDWVKASLLYWDKIYRITPKNYIPNDNQTILEAIDYGLIKDITLEGKDLSKTADEFTKYCENLPFIPSGLECCERIHPDKVDARLYPFLESISCKFDKSGWLKLSGPLTRGYMFYLSKVVAERRNLARATDNIDSWAIAPYFDKEGEIDSSYFSENAEGYYSYLIIEDLIPADLSNIPIEKIIDFIDENKKTKAKFREKISEFAINLRNCESSDFAHDLIDSFKAELEDSKEELTNSLSLLNSGNSYALLTIGIPAGLSVLGAISLYSDPHSLQNIFGSILFGTLASYSAYSSYVKQEKENSSLTYLVNMDSYFNNSPKMTQRASYSLDQFIND